MWYALDSQHSIGFLTLLLKLSDVWANEPWFNSRGTAIYINKILKIYLIKSIQKYTAHHQKHL